jgi:hypothetical protein
MKRLLLTVAAAAALALPGTAAAGCWATVGLSSLPKGLHAGDAWTVNVTVKQHGNKLLAGAKPTLTIVNADGVETVFRARATARKGVYRTRVVFPTAGRWTFTVFDGFVPSCGREHTFAPVSVLP